MGPASTSRFNRFKQRNFSVASNHCFLSPDIGSIDKLTGPIMKELYVKKKPTELDSMLKTVSQHSSPGNSPKKTKTKKKILSPEEKKVLKAMA
jgi:hypothetical protein